MNERLHRYLDGELPRGELTPEELRQVALYEAMARETEQSFRSIAVPDLTASVMARIQPSYQAPHEAGSLRTILRKTVGWLWAPRSVRLRPAYVFVMTALLLFIVAFPRNEAPDAVSVAGKVFVQFRLDAPGAKTVRLAGSFTGWKPSYTLQEVTPGTWSILIPLDSGVYNYAFVVNDGQWLQDPAAPAVPDGFGGVNSRLSVLLPGNKG